MKELVYHVENYCDDTKINEVLSSTQTCKNVSVKAYYSLFVVVAVFKTITHF